MTYCYLCEKEWTGYYGDYFCKECSNLKKVVCVVGAKKITDNIRFQTKKVELEFLDSNKEVDNGENNYNLRSKDR